MTTIQCSKCGKNIECEPDGPCWCKELEIKLPVSSGSCMCKECLLDMAKKEDISKVGID